MNIYSKIKEGQHSLSYILEYFSTEEEAQKAADALKAEGKFDKITNEGNEYAVWAFYEPQTKAESEDDYEDFVDEDTLACCMCGRIIDNPADACVEDDTDPYPDVYCVDCWNERMTTEKEDLKEAFVLPNVNQLVEEISKYVEVEPVEDEEGITLKVLGGVLNIDPEGVITFKAEWLTDINNSLTFRRVEDFINAIAMLSEMFK